MNPFAIYDTRRELFQEAVHEGTGDGRWRKEEGAKGSGARPQKKNHNEAEVPSSP